jgi:hypothetical protein
MSKNSQHSRKLNKRFEEMERRNRERQGKMTEAPREPQPERIGEILEAPDPRTLESMRRSHSA